MNVTFEVTSPNNCGHMHIKVINGNNVHNFVYEISNLNRNVSDEELEIMLKGFLRYLVNTNNMDTLQKFKNALEGKTFKI